MINTSTTIVNSLNNTISPFLKINILNSDKWKLLELNFLSEETGNFQTDISIKIFDKNYGIKNYDPPLSDS